MGADQGTVSSTRKNMRGKAGLGSLKGMAMGAPVPGVVEAMVPGASKAGRRRRM